MSAKIIPEKRWETWVRNLSRIDDCNKSQL